MSRIAISWAMRRTPNRTRRAPRRRAAFAAHPPCGSNPEPRKRARRALQPRHRNSAELTRRRRGAVLQDDGFASSRYRCREPCGGCSGACCGCAQLAGAATDSGAAGSGHEHRAATRVGRDTSAFVLAGLRIVLLEPPGGQRCLCRFHSTEVAERPAPRARPTRRRAPLPSAVCAVEALGLISR